MDPLGLALENFDVTGRWRIKDSGVPVDATGELYDGFEIDGPAGLRQALLKHSDMVLLSFTESLMPYALGRRVEYYDMPTIRTIIRDAAKTDNRLSSFILGVVRSAAFQMSRAESAITTDRIIEFSRINRYHVSLIPYFLEKLKSIPDGDSNLLENTLVIYGSPMGNPNVHNHKRCPLFLAGHAGGTLKGNLHVRAADGTPMANVFLTLLHGLGLDDLSSFGDSTGAVDLTNQS